MHHQSPLFSRKKALNRKNHFPSVRLGLRPPRSSQTSRFIVSEFLTAPQTPATSTIWGQLCAGHCANPEGPAEPGRAFNRSSQGRGGRQESSHQGCDVVSARTGVHSHRSSRPTLVAREGSVYQRQTQRQKSCKTLHHSRSIRDSVLSSSVSSSSAGEAV